MAARSVSARPPGEAVAMALTPGHHYVAVGWKRKRSGRIMTSDRSVVTLPPAPKREDAGQDGRRAGPTIAEDKWEPRSDDAARVPGPTTERSGHRLGGQRLPVRRECNRLTPPRPSASNHPASARSTAARSGRGTGGQRLPIRRECNELTPPCDLSARITWPLRSTAARSGRRHRRPASAHPQRMQPTDPAFVTSQPRITRPVCVPQQHGLVAGTGGQRLPIRRECNRRPRLCDPSARITRPGSAFPQHGGRRHRRPASAHP
jgi:hypothetical protein